MGVNHTLGLAGGSGREQDERVVIEDRPIGQPSECGDSRFGLLIGERDGDAIGGQRCRGGWIGRATPDREAGPSRARQGFHLERRESRIDRYGAPSEPPDREQVGEELETVAVVKENPVAARQIVLEVERHPTLDPGPDFALGPMPAGQGLGQGP